MSASDPLTAARIRVFVAASLDGYIAGPGDDLSWLPEIHGGEVPEEGVLTYEALMAEVGVLLMGRRTYDVVRGFDVPWPYLGKPVLVATGRPLDDDPPEGVRAVAGPIQELIHEARVAGGAGDIYLDGGQLIAQACAAGLVDEVTIAVAPVALGSGYPLFPGLTDPCAFALHSVHPHPGGMVQLRLRPVRAEGRAGPDTGTRGDASEGQEETPR